LMTSVKEPVVETTEPATLEQPTEELSATESTYAAETLLSPVAEEIPHQEAAHIVSEQLPAPQDSLPTETTVSGEPTPAPSTSTDEIVAKVLARMSPDVLQAVTREILKPLVEAMIKDELRKK